MSIRRYLRQHGEIQRQTLQDDGGGFKVPTWLSILSTRGRLRPLTGHERWQSQTTVGESSHRWYCLPFTLMVDPEEQAAFFGAPFQPSPYGEALPADVTTADRLVVGGAIYNIAFIADPMSMGRFLQIDVKQVESEQE